MSTREGRLLQSHRKGKKDAEQEQNNLHVDADKKQ
jgi:hypothetical protein